MVQFTWGAAIILQNDPGIVGYQYAELSIDRTTYVSWAVQNATIIAVPRAFFVDLLLDDVVVGRWLVSGLQASARREVRDWTELEQAVRPRVGAHTMKLVVDSTNLVPEINETDNVVERPFTWTSSSSFDGPASGPLPDLVPSAPDGWSGPIVATSYSSETVDGPLSVDVPTYLRYGFRNDGAADAPSPFWVYLYLDDVLVERRLWNAAAAGLAFQSEAWSGLFDMTPVSAGPHTLRIEVDATNLVEEADEENNSFATEFVWQTGPVPPNPSSASS